MADAKTKEERHANTERNKIINRASDDLDKIVRGHDPDIHHLGNRVWDRLDDMAVEIEALAAPQPADVPHDVVRALEPFAKYMDGGLDRDDKEQPLPDDHGVGWVYLTMGDFRRASAAYAALATPAPSTSTDALRAENARLTEALTQIGERSLPSQPATDAGDELSWAQRQYAQLRSIALSALSR